MDNIIDSVHRNFKEAFEGAKGIHSPLPTRPAYIGLESNDVIPTSQPESDGTEHCKDGFIENYNRVHMSDGGKSVGEDEKDVDGEEEEEVEEEEEEEEDNDVDENNDGRTSMKEQFEEMKHIEENIPHAPAPKTPPPKNVSNLVEDLVMNFPMPIFVCVSSMFTPSLFVLSFP
jgi:hypothetical protein